MTNQDALYALRSMKNESVNSFRTDALDMAIKALEEQQWIPCSERLPEKETRWYLVCSPHGQIGER